MCSDNFPRFNRYLFCICEAGICDLRPCLRNDPDHRLFYKCLTPKCSRGKNNFFKYEDKVNDDHVFIDVTNCGCNGGPCRVAREKEPGPNAGKIVFKEGHRACNYKVYHRRAVTCNRAGPQG